MAEKHGRNGADVLTGNGGADTFAYLKKDLAGGSIDTNTDFEIGRDHLAMSDFLKGRANSADRICFVASGGDTIVQGHIKAAWVDVVVRKDVDVRDVGYDILT